MLLLLDGAHNFSRSKKRCPVRFLSKLMDGLPKMSRIPPIGVRSDVVSRRTEMRVDPIHTVESRRRCDVEIMPLLDGLAAESLRGGTETKFSCEV